MSMYHSRSQGKSNLTFKLLASKKLLQESSDQILVNLATQTSCFQIRCYLCVSHDLLMPIKIEQRDKGMTFFDIKVNWYAINQQQAFQSYQIPDTNDGCFNLSKICLDNILKTNIC